MALGLEESWNRDIIASPSPKVLVHPGSNAVGRAGRAVFSKRYTCDVTTAIEERHALVRDTAREFAQKRLKPLAQRIEESEQIPRELFRELGELGLLGVAIPEAYGGAEAGFLAAFCAMEELAKVSAGFALSYGAHAFLCARNLYAHADEAQRGRFLPKLVSGEAIGAFALTEPGAGSDAAGLTTKAARDGKGYRLDGTKIFITNGAVADLFLVFARTERSKGRGALSAFVVERDRPGVSVGREIPKLGTRGSSLSEIVFSACRVPAENLLGEEGRGLAYMMAGLDMERAVFTGLAVGIAEAALEAAVDYAKVRRQFGQPIASFQMVQQMLAQTATEIEAARLLAERAALMLDRGEDITKQASFAKLFGAQMVLRATQTAVQVLGGYGFTREFPVERFYRDAALVGIGGGTSQIQVLIIAKELMKEASARGRRG